MREQQPPSSGWAVRAAAIVGWGPVVEGRRVLDRYDAAGGALIAGGLAYSALFALVPTILLMLGVGGAIAGQGPGRDQFVRTIAAVLPPLSGLIQTALDQLGRDSAPISIVALVGMVWGTSRFSVALEAAFARIFDEFPRRGLIRQTALGLGSVLVLVVAVVLGAALPGIASFLQAAVAVGAIPVVRSASIIGLQLAAPVATTVALLVLYRIVPSRRPAWRSILPPAILAALVLTVLTRLFVYLAPRLIGAAAVLGTVATVFAALAWLGLSFQAILVGAAWVRERDDPPGPTATPQP